MNFLVIVLVIMVGSVLFIQADKRMKQQFIDRTRTAWRRDGLDIGYGPTGVTCFGSKPDSLYNRRQFGAVGIVDGRLIFLGQRNAQWDLDIPLHQILGLASCKIRLHQGKTSIELPASEIHMEEDGQWRVYIFTQDEPRDLLDAIRSQVGSTIPERTTIKHITPGDAHLLYQDVYGEWHEEGEGEVYLAPDQMLFQWQPLLHFAQIRRIAVVERGGLSSLNPFAEDLVRIEYQDEQLSTMGLLMRGAEDFAEMVAKVANIPLDIQTGRKKKEHD